MNGIVLWEGPSPIDGAPLVCIATGLRRGSANSKTGKLVQTFILRADMAPLFALGSGADVSTCGQCSHRPFLGGKCYVNVGQGPTSVFKAYRKRRYPKRGQDGWAEAHARLMGLPVRAGTYGDPALVPMDVWARLRVVTGYTHQWRAPFAAGHRSILMASVDGPGDVADAKRAGWRYFYVRKEADAVPKDAVECPSSRGVQCEDCRLCGGLQKAGAKSIWIAPHGFRVGNGTVDVAVATGRLRVLQ